MVEELRVGEGGGAGRLGGRGSLTTGGLSKQDADVANRADWGPDSLQSRLISPSGLRPVSATLSPN